ncbi:hypothetical protein G6F40_016082 [Rhizopus arrhizus]|nr:hypothetical protein G6F40_016082 [Rhizopus arrhizus]
MACKDSFKRNMAGRLVGVSKDSQGNPAMRDVEHLHRAGAAGGDGVDVRRLPRPGRPDPHRPPHPPPGLDPGRGAAHGRRAGRWRLLRHPAWHRRARR